MYRRLKSAFANQKTAKKILFIMLLTIICPVVLVTAAVCTIWSNMIISKTNDLMESRMRMSQERLEEYFTAYENIIMAMYTSNQYAEDLERLNMMDTQNYFKIRYNVEESLQNTAYLYPGILGIELCSRKNNIYYDSLTRCGSESFCFSANNMVWKELASETLTKTQTLYRSAQWIEAGEEKLNVIYIAHRLADLNNYAKGTIGSIILCVDERDIRSIYAKDVDETQIFWLCDDMGNIVSCSDEQFIGRSIMPQDKGMLTMENAEQYAQEAVGRYEMMDGNYLICVSPVCDGAFFQFSVQDEDVLLKDLKYLVAIIVLIGIMSMLAGGMITIRFAEYIENNMQKIITAMDEAHDGNYHGQIQNEHNDEFGKISRHFNYMVRQIETSTRQEKEMLIREKNAEIRALEAQINPHFLYNTLDAINWIAIENEQFKISKMLKSLAVILRYSIQYSNEMVYLENEIEYLKKYILLQQLRFDFSFKCFLHIDESVRECRVHKLLFQPLVENAIVHGFPGKSGEDIIWIGAERDEDAGQVCITVRDNGNGMDAELVEELNHFDYRHNTVESSIGVRNVFMRVKYYYGEKGAFAVSSSKEGTEIKLWISYEG